MTATTGTRAALTLHGTVFEAYSIGTAPADTSPENFAKAVATDPRAPANAIYVANPSGEVFVADARGPVRDVSCNERGLLLSGGTRSVATVLFVVKTTLAVESGLGAAILGAAALIVGPKQRLQ